MATTGTIIKQLRITKGLSQAELATALGYKDRTTIAKIEAGSIEPSLGKLEEIAKYFNVTLAHLRNTLERNLNAMDYEITYEKNGVVRVKDTSQQDVVREFSAEEWANLHKTGSADVVIHLLQTGGKGSASDDRAIIEGLPENKRWLVDYVMSLTEDEAKQFRGIVEFIHAQKW